MSLKTEKTHDRYNERKREREIEKKDTEKERKIEKERKKGTEPREQANTIYKNKDKWCEALFYWAKNSNYIER